LIGINVDLVSLSRTKSRRCIAGFAVGSGEYLPQKMEKDMREHTSFDRLDVGSLQHRRDVFDSRIINGENAFSRLSRDIYPDSGPAAAVATASQYRDGGRSRHRESIRTLMESKQGHQFVEDSLDMIHMNRSEECGSEEGTVNGDTRRTYSMVELCAREYSVRAKRERVKLLFAVGVTSRALFLFRRLRRSLVLTYLYFIPPFHPIQLLE
jgi:hypothetical protein